MAAEVLEIETPAGMARAHLWRPPRRSQAASTARPTLVLGHGAGGGVESADLQGLTAMTADGWQVVLVEQPWRVAGRRVATAPPSLDVGWLAVMRSLSRRIRGPLVIGGRSAGARVACRTAAELRPVGVLTLSFPLHPPRRAGPAGSAAPAGPASADPAGPGRDPSKSRAFEARLVTEAGTRLAVIQGVSDPFGTPAEVSAELGPGAEVFAARGNHGFSADPSDAVQLARRWVLSLTL